ncbi:MAG: tetratricopeptide repeat protein [Clostridia bacterium]|nr:tetratricopeptide repeat protein [Clostridia bacterium]
MIFLILTTLLIITIFIFSFARLVKNNSFEYVYVLVSQFLGILVDFVVIIRGTEPSAWVYIIIYFFSVLIPVIVMLLENQSIYLGEISLLLSKKNVDKKLILKTIDKHPNSYIAHKRLAEYYKANLEMEKVEREYEKLIEIRPNDYSIYCELSDIYNENSKNDKAIEVLQEVLKIKPDYYEASLKLGNLLYENENFKDAILVYNEALRHNPKEYYLYYCLGMTYTRINDFNNAKECYKKAATINSIKDISNLTIGQIYLIFEDYDKAEEYFYKTLDCEDDEVLANSYFYLAKIRLIQNNENQAIQYSNLAIDFNPKMIDRMRNDELFITILGKLSIKTYKKVNTKIDDKEKATIEHLGKTYNVVETLTSNFSKKNNNTIDKENEITK